MGCIWVLIRSEFNLQSYFNVIKIENAIKKLNLKTCREVTGVLGEWMEFEDLIANF